MTGHGVPLCYVKRFDVFTAMTFALLDR